MISVYYDSGTTNTRIYLMEEEKVLDQMFLEAGTRDSAISGDRSILLRKLKEGYDALLGRNGMKDSDVEEIYLSGMITNPFGIIEVPHLETPIHKEALYKSIYTHEEETFFLRPLKLILGAKTRRPQEGLHLGNVQLMGNTRGEEIEVMGLLRLGYLKEDKTQVMISPGSHTHMMLIRKGAIEDISSHFTGELHHAILKETILGGETAKNVKVYHKEPVLRGYELLVKEGISRALYVVHSTKVFGLSSDEERQMLLTGVISGSPILHLKEKMRAQWKDVEEIIILGTASYVSAYEMILKEVLPGVAVKVVSPAEESSFALEGFRNLMTVRERG
ncbi:2-dehydro-3-deoxygalactonokinase [Proteiniclasticum sp. C24MP]|uniref:2-dehydro-3-deoxygalactonokinase n=1 Tax=Proteiniclasticum sp. C24MP TaxID=3374101 RepID=UPI0037546DFD